MADCGPTFKHTLHEPLTNRRSAVKGCILHSAQSDRVAAAGGEPEGRGRGAWKSKGSKCVCHVATLTGRPWASRCGGGRLAAHMSKRAVGPGRKGAAGKPGGGAAALERKTIRQYALGKQRQGQWGVGGGCRAADGRMRQCDQRRVLICGAAGWAKNLVVVRL